MTQRASPIAGPPAAVTCIIPTHRRIESLMVAVESAQGQTLPPALVVVVDDTGSADVRARVESATGPVPTLYVDGSGNDPKGASSSRNLGATFATTPLLAFLDDDDRWEPGFLEACVERLRAADADLGIAWGTIEVGGQPGRRSWAMRAGIDAADCVALNPGMTGSNFVVRRSAFDAVGGFDAGLPVYNDLDFLVRSLRRGSTYAVVERELVVQNGDGQDHLSSRGPRRVAGIERYIDKHRDRLGSRDLRLLRRDLHLAHRHPAQPLRRRVFHFAMMWLHSSPHHVAQLLRERFAAGGRSYA